MSVRVDYVGFRNQERALGYDSASAPQSPPAYMGMTSYHPTSLPPSLDLTSLTPMQSLRQVRHHMTMRLVIAPHTPQ